MRELEINTPEAYEPPTIEPLGSVWERTGSAGGTVTDFPGAGQQVGS